MHSALIFTLALTAPPATIQGTWHGTGPDERHTIVFCEEWMAVGLGTEPLLQPKESRFRIDPRLGTIDVQRDKGVQLGRFQIDGDQLILMLADVGQPRPESIDFPLLSPTSGTIVIDKKNPPKPRAQRRYVFRRPE